MTVYVRPPTNPDGSRKSYAQRRAERRQRDSERRTKQTGEQTASDPIYNLPAHERRRIRRAEEQGQREAEHLAALAEKARRQAEYDALPEHERWPRNQWRDLIEMRKPDAWRPDVARRIAIYEQEAVKEDARIDAIMGDKRKRHELESAPEYAKALAHWERASMRAESEDERQEWARLKGLIEGGGASDYWYQVEPIMKTRLERLERLTAENAAKQTPLAEEARVIAEEREATEELQVKNEQANEATQPE